MKLAKLTLCIFALGVFANANAADKASKYNDMAPAKQVADLADDDRDGVVNARDKCMTTPLGAEVDNTGCSSHVMAENQFQLKILFANDSSEINPAFLNEIKRMVEFLSQYPQTAIELQGYASKVGKSDYNMKLSQQRASKVRQSLIDAGIDSSRVTILGFGDTALADKGSSEVAHALNRRVIASVVGHNDKILDEWNIYTKRKR